MTDAQKPEVEEQRAERKPRVLVADDEITIMTTLKVILSLEGFDVEVARNGHESVAKALLWHPDLVLSDVVMPGMNGVDACIRIVDSLPGCKIVLMSGHAVVHDLMNDARARGYNFDVLPKPVHPDELIEHLRVVLRRDSAG